MDKTTLFSRIFMSALLLALPVFAPLCAHAQEEAAPSHVIVDARPEMGGLPIITGEMKGQQVRIFIDPSLNGFAAINPDMAETLGLNGLPLLRIKAQVDEAELIGKVGRLSLTINGEKKMLWAALMQRPHSPDGKNDHYDAAAGLDAIAADKITIIFRDLPAETLKPIVFEKDKKGKGYPVIIDGIEIMANFQFLNPSSWLNREASSFMVKRQYVLPKGAVNFMPVWFGMKMPVQDVDILKPLYATDLPITHLVARTKDELVAPEPEEGAPQSDNEITVTAKSRKKDPPGLAIGMDDLAHCASMIYEPELRKMTLMCQ